MKMQFKNILEIIDKVNQEGKSNTSLFQTSDAINPAEKDLLKKWSGKSVDEIKQIISPVYGKRQVGYNPFIEAGSDMHSPVVFSHLLPEENPDINYAYEESSYGPVIIASTVKGICHLVFFNGNEEKIPAILNKEFPGSVITRGIDEHQKAALNYLAGKSGQVIHLDVKGSNDQLHIWEALTKVPAGKLISYGTLAKATNHMAQDIGIAMGDNRISILIPCHRVIKATGELGQYHWGAKRKQAMIIREAIL